MIAVNNLVFEYPGHRALDRVSFDIRAGSITALVGPNGAGKTTLLRCLAGLVRPVYGEMRINGIDVLEEPHRAHACIGYLSDFFGLYDDLTVRQCLLFLALSHSIAESRLDSAVLEAASKTGIADLMERKAGNLSRGQRQRLGIAQALLHDPEVLILDEPASGLDPEARAELSHLVRSLQAAGKTILVSSHILSELEDYSTDMLIIDCGRIVEQQVVAGSGRTQVPVVIELEPDAAFDVAQLDMFAPFQRQGVQGLRIHGTLEQGTTPAALLRWLVQQQVPVCAFYEDSPDMQARYIESVQRHRHENQPAPKKFGLSVPPKAGQGARS
ncbi:MAG TPA: ABC transporter ATP-binding protein [Pseudomonadales bacterium]|nr:ABC transporter ATP-binding protein [Pseudomonadales bacterium]